MVVDKQKSKRKVGGGSSIARAIIENNKKFRVIDELYQKHKKAYQKKLELMTKIMEIYQIGFKRLSKTKKSIGSINGITYYISTKGIIKPNHRGIHEDLIKSFSYDKNLNEELVKIGKNLNIFKQHLNKNQKRVFTNFFRYFILLRNERLILLKCQKSIIEINTGFTESPYTLKDIDAITLNPSGGLSGDFDFIFLKNGKMIINIRFSRLYMASGLNEKIFIEQTSSYIKTLLKKEIINREKEIKRLESFYLKVKENFRDYLMLEVIEKDN